MRIPEASANAGGYYNEESAPWQNGVIMDGAHAGGAAGDAAYHPPHYTQPQRPPHVSGPGGYIVPGGAYYGGYGPVPAPVPAPPDDFSDYMWMENEEEFDKQVMQQLEEEALMEQCIEAMLEDERASERERVNGHSGASNCSVGIASLEEQVSKSTLNPLAAEFVPTRSTSTPTVSALSLDKAEPVEVSVNDVVSDTKERIPEASAQIEVTQTKEAETKCEVKSKGKLERKKSDECKAKTEAKKPEARKEKSKAEVKPAKAESKPVKMEPKVEAKPKVEVKPVKSEIKPAKAKSEAKVAPKPAKKEVKTVRSEGTVADKELSKPAETDVVAPAAVDVAKVQPVIAAEPNVAAPAPAFKPINYAAAARANKPRKPSDPAVNVASVAQTK